MATHPVCGPEFAGPLLAGHALLPRPARHHVVQPGRGGASAADSAAAGHPPAPAAGVSPQGPSDPRPTGFLVRNPTPDRLWPVCFSKGRPLAASAAARAPFPYLSA